MKPYRSKKTTHGRQMAGARALWRGTGFKTEDFEKPKMFSIKRNVVDEPLETVEIEINQIRKKLAKSN